MNRDTLLPNTNPSEKSIEFVDTILDTILIEGLEFYGFHGVPDAEQAVGHRYSLDVYLSVDVRQAAASDNVGDTVNYAEVAKMLIALGTQTQSRLLEHLAERMIRAILERYTRVQAVTLCLRKLFPPMNAIAASVGVKITRQRHLE